MVAIFRVARNVLNKITLEPRFKCVQGINPAFRGKGPKMGASEAQQGGQWGWNGES